MGELGKALEQLENRREARRVKQNQRIREQYQYLRSCGVPYDVASLASQWGKKRIEKLLDEIAS